LGRLSLFNDEKSIDAIWRFWDMWFVLILFAEFEGRFILKQHTWSSSSYIHELPFHRACDICKDISKERLRAWAVDSRRTFSLLAPNCLSDYLKYIFL
jgi:hypothetical protein